ncbi:hypothetical protein P7C70_g6867, partial [Phenoliferia sp. Uapishka_3]
MTIFSKSAIIFISCNILRVLSIVAIALALSGELVTMISDIKGYQGRNSDSTSTSATRFRVRRELQNPYTTSLASATTVKSQAKPTATLNAVVAAASASASVTSSSTSTASAASASATTCSYVGNTSVPKSTGGILFSTLDRIFVCIICIFMLFAEMPPPTQFTQRFWAYAFPPFGDSFGVGVLGVIQVFVGCSMLSKSSSSVTGLPEVAGWFLFIVAFLNIIFGLAFGNSIKPTRSIFSLPTTPSGLRQLNLKTPLARNGAPPAGTAASTFYANGQAEQEGSSVSFYSVPAPTVKKGRPIHISPPMMQKENNGAPPVYPQYNQ